MKCDYIYDSMFSMCAVNKNSDNGDSYTDMILFHDADLLGSRYCYVECRCLAYGIVAGNDRDGVVIRLKRHIVDAQTKPV